VRGGVPLPPHPPCRSPGFLQWRHAQLLGRNNTVVITGRDQARLEATRKQLPGVHIIQSDVGDPKAISVVFEEVTKRFPTLNVLINNAGVMRELNLHDTSDSLEDVSREIETNLIGPVRMVKQFLPQLKAQPSAAIVNISSGLAFTPFPISPIYRAAKAGVHSFTQFLRAQLKHTSVKVFELAPPSTQTPLNNVFDSADVKGNPVMDVKKLVRHAIAGLHKDQLDILPGRSKVLRLASRIAPDLAVKAASGPVDAMLAQDFRTASINFSQSALG
jgi:uncharacterized oxidoreductase